MSESGLAPPPAAPLDAVAVERLASIARRAADAAAVITLANFRVELAIQDKSVPDGLFDPVTLADREAERVIRELFARECPEIGFVGEESAPAIPLGSDHAGACWVVDPIDGTRAYITGMPLWGTLIALNEGGEIRYGLLDQPFLGERYEGVAGEATLKDRCGRHTLRTREVPVLGEAVLYCTTPEMFTTDDRLVGFQRVAEAARLVRFGGDCYAYAMLASGRVDLVVEDSLAPWDIQALVPIVRGAGGCITNWQGGDPSMGGAIVASGCERLHDVVLERLAVR